MGRVTRHPTRRDLPLVARFRRAVWLGFAVVATVGLGTLILTEVTSRSVGSAQEVAVVAAQQRLDLSQLSSDLSRLAGTEDPVFESKYRTLVGDGLDAIRNNQVQLEINGSAAAFAMVDVADSPTLRDVIDRTIEAVKMTIERLEVGDGELPGPPPDIAFTLDRIARLDAPYAHLESMAYADLDNTRNLIRDGGRMIAVIAIVVALIRLLVVGRPLVARLERAQAEVEAERSRAVAEVARQDLSTRMGDGMETANSEMAALAVVERALGRVVPGRRAELLLADSSMAHMVVAAVNGDMPVPGCKVTSPWSCPAVRRSETIIFDDSESMRACPYLTGRDGGSCAALCVPVTFMGGSMGVLHVTGEVGWIPGHDVVESLQLVSHHAAMRIGTLRSFAKAEVQASTDVLTGLPNRRATEDHLRAFLAGRERGAIALADLDHFKALNDTYGHDVGDRALRTFADTVRAALRHGDWVGRWGGEEFVMLLPGLSANEAKEILDRVRQRLIVQCEESDNPTFTVSIGVVDTTAGSNTEDLVRLADESLYAAKTTGRDRVMVGPVSPRVVDEQDEIESLPQR